MPRPALLSGSTTRLCCTHLARVAIWHTLHGMLLSCRSRVYLVSVLCKSDHDRHANCGLCMRCVAVHEMPSAVLRQVLGLQTMVLADPNLVDSASGLHIVGCTYDYCLFIRILARLLLNVSCLAVPVLHSARWWTVCLVAPQGFGLFVSILFSFGGKPVAEVSARCACRSNIGCTPHTIGIKLMKVC